MSEDRNDCANCSKLQSRVDRLEQGVDYLLNRIDEQDSAVRGAKRIELHGLKQSNLEPGSSQ